MFASDTLREIVINETLVKRLGLKDPQQAIGKNLRIGAGQLASGCWSSEGF